MPHDPGIVEIGVRALENVKVRPADSHSANLDEGFVRAAKRLGAVLQIQLPRLATNQNSHLQPRWFRAAPGQPVTPHGKSGNAIMQRPRTATDWCLFRRLTV